MGANVISDSQIAKDIGFSGKRRGGGRFAIGNTFFLSSLRKKGVERQHVFFFFFFGVGLNIHVHVGSRTTTVFERK